MSKKEYTKVRKNLEVKLAELRNADRRSGLITERSNDPMDQIQSRIDLDMAVLALNTDFKTRRAVETAISLLETGEYGICQECGEPINPKRLEAIPWTTLCVRCQEARDAQQENETAVDFEKAA
jgi:RNA polymerase-binding transcription factor